MDDIKKWQEDFREYVNGLCLPKDDHDGIMEYISEIPSAQPETCAYWDRESNICALHRPSAQPEISRIEQELHGKTPEEQYEFLYWLLLIFGLTYTDSRLAVIEWLRGERNE